jgi:hypothetical protein
MIMARMWISDWFGTTGLLLPRRPRLPQLQVMKIQTTEGAEDAEKSSRETVRDAVWRDAENWSLSERVRK